MPQITRQIAFKCWISDLANGSYVKQEGWQPNFIEAAGKKISRVNILANVVDVFLSDDGNYATITLDDGSDTIRVKAFKEDTTLIKDLKIGDMLLVIGRPREYNNEIYILPEIVKNLDDPNWELVRKLELLKIYGKPKQVLKVEKPEPTEAEPEKTEVAQEPVQEKQVVEEEVIEDTTETVRQKILNIIEKTEEGKDISDIVKESGLSEEEAEKVIQELLKEGEVFESRPGRVMLV